VERVWISVYEEDDESLAIWRDVIGVAPERIQRMGAADNFWSSGPTGPCGPCSEMYYDFHPERGHEGAVGGLLLLLSSNISRDAGGWFAVNDTRPFVLPEKSSVALSESGGSKERVEEGLRVVLFGSLACKSSAINVS
jgi:hypothetical protein